MDISRNVSYEPFLPEISSSFSQSLDKIWNDPFASPADKKTADTVISIIQDTRDHIALTKIHELSTELNNPASAIERRYSSLLEGEYEKYNNFKQQLEQIFDKLRTATRLQAKASAELETDPARQSARQQTQKAIDDYKTIRSNLAAAFPRDSELYDKFVLLQAENNSLVEKFELSLLTLPTSLDHAFMNKEQAASNSFPLIATEIWKDTRNIIDILSKEMEFLREAQMTSREPIKEHLRFLQDIINAALGPTVLNRDNFPSLQRMQVLQQEERAFAGAYNCVALAFTNPLFPRQAVVTVAQGLQKTMIEKADIVVQKIVTCFHAIKRETPLAVRDQLAKATRCWNPLCPHQQEQKDLFISDKLPAVLSRCTGCMQARYCSKECQKLDWPEHRKTCQLTKMSAK